MKIKLMRKVREIKIPIIVHQKLEKIICTFPT